MVAATEDIDEDDIGANSDEYTFNSTLAANSQDDLAPFLKNDGWDEIESTKGQRVWTDDYSNIRGSIIRNWRKAKDEEEEE